MANVTAPNVTDPDAPPDDVIIRVRDLRSHYGTTEILHGVDLDVIRGETLVILGTSGCGKSTFLRNLVGLHRPSSGRVWLCGQEVTGLDERSFDQLKRKFGILFQSAALFNSMTVGDNVALPLREHTELDENVIQIMVRIKLEQVGLQGTEHKMPSELSGGMKKRAGLARAIAMDPQLLFFDEPSAGLDPIVSADIDQLIMGLKSALNITMVIVTHEMRSAFRIADRMCVFLKGDVIFLGTPDQIHDCDHPFVKQFLAAEPNPIVQSDGKLDDLAAHRRNRKGGRH